MTDPVIPKTPQEDLVQSAATARQNINMLWERTQCIVAVMVVTVTMAVEVFLVYIRAPEQIPSLLAVAFGTVVGFYFGRTNHTRPGPPVEPHL